MKVAIVGGLPEKPKDIGGDFAALSPAVACASALAELGDEVTVYVRDDGQPATGDVLGRLRVVSVPAGPARPLAVSAAQPFVSEFARNLRTLWDADRPDVIHTHASSLGFAAQLVADSLLLPTVLSFDGAGAAVRYSNGSSFLEMSGRVRMESLLAKAATWVIASSANELDMLAQTRRSHDHLTVVPDTIDLAPFYPARALYRAGSPVRILALGSTFGPESGIGSAIRALAAVPDAVLTAAATTPASDGPAPLRRLAAAAGVGHRVHFAVARQSRILNAYLQTTDIATCTPDRASNAAHALAAMACGIPVVATGLGALVDAVLNDVTGVVVRPSRPAEVAAAVESLGADPFRRLRMGAAGRDRVSSHFSRQRLAADLHKVYENAVASSHCGKRRTRTRDRGVTLPRRRPLQGLRRTDTKTTHEVPCAGSLSGPGGSLSAET